MFKRLFNKLFSGFNISNNISQLYVGNIPYKISKGEIDRVFSKYGKIVEIRIVRDRNTGESKGFGFITFESASDAKKALKLNQFKLKGRPIIVSYAKERN